MTSDGEIIDAAAALEPDYGLAPGGWCRSRVAERHRRQISAHSRPVLAATRRAGSRRCDQLITGHLQSRSSEHGRGLPSWLPTGDCPSTPRGPQAQGGKALSAAGCGAGRLGPLRLGAWARRAPPLGAVKSDAHDDYILLLGDVVRLDVD